MRETESPVAEKEIARSSYGRVNTSSFDWEKRGDIMEKFREQMSYTGDEVEVTKEDALSFFSRHSTLAVETLNWLEEKKLFKPHKEEEQRKAG